MVGFLTLVNVALRIWSICVLFALCVSGEPRCPDVLSGVVSSGLQEVNESQGYILLQRGATLHRTSQNKDNKTKDVHKEKAVAEEGDDDISIMDVALNMLRSWAPMFYSVGNLITFMFFLAFVVEASTNRSQTQKEQGHDTADPEGGQSGAHSESVVSDNSLQRMPCLVHFWWADLGPLRSLYHSLAAFVMFAHFFTFGTSLHKTSLSPNENLDWEMFFLPLAAMLVGLGRMDPSCRVGSKLHWCTIVTLTFVTIVVASADRAFTLSHCCHRWLPFTWVLFGATIAIWALLAVPEGEVSAWLRKWALLVCVVTYLNGGISKMLNSPHPWDWGSGEILRHWIMKTRANDQARWSHLSVFFSESPLICCLAAIATLLFELPLSLLALLGPGEFGYLGRLRALWAFAAICFHFGIYLIMVPNYNIQSYIIIIFCLDGVGRLFFETGSQGERHHAQRSCKQVNMVKALLAFLCTAVLITWIAVALLWHFPADDPKWPVSSIPMYSIRCGVCDCQDKFRKGVVHLSDFFR